MALDPSNCSNLEQLALKGLIIIVFFHFTVTLTTIRSVPIRALEVGDYQTTRSEKLLFVFVRL